LEYKMLFSRPRKNFSGGIRSIAIALSSHSYQENHFVLVIPRLTSTQLKFMKGNSMAIKTTVTSQKLTPVNCQTLTASSAASLVRRLVLLADDEGLTIPEGRCSLTLREYCELNNLNYSFLRTLKGFSTINIRTRKQTNTQHLRPSSPRLMSWGTTVNGRCFNSKDFGVPQNRERVIIVGHLRGTPRPQVFPISESNKTSDGYRSKRDRILSSTLDSSYYKGHDGKRQLIQDGAEIRRLTPLECERLQGFPDNWTEYGIIKYDVPEGQKFSYVLHTSNLIPISNTQRYKMCGNAVTTKVIQAVFERILV